MTLPLVIAHRGCVNGPLAADDENTLDALYGALAEGYGVETDLRCALDDEQTLVLSHDPAPASVQRDGLEFLRELAALDDQPRAVALNVKDEGGLAILLRHRGELEHLTDPESPLEVFLFDFELALLGRTAEVAKVACAQAGFRVAHRLSNHQDEHYLGPLARGICASQGTAWLDEFPDLPDYPFATSRRVAEAARAGFRVHVVSPDLHGEHDPDQLERRWRNWLSATRPPDGICTKYARTLSTLGSRLRP